MYSWLISKFKNIRIRITPNVREKELERFHKDNGKDLKFKYLKLNEKSIVFDLGGYEGNFSSNLFSRSPCKIHIFEPVPNFAKNIKERFKNNKNIICNAYGLCSNNKEKIINLLGDDTSSYKDQKINESNSVNIKLKDIVEYIKENSIENIDLMKINIEGGEYEILNHLINSQKIKYFKQLLIQFHDIEIDSIKKRNDIRESLKKTHACKFCYEFVWELWVKI